MLDVNEARQRILAAIKPLGAEVVALRSALGRYLATEIIAPIDLPGCDNSAMDGYALLAADVAAASESSPVPLHIAARIPAGDAPDLVLRAGTCARIFTGSMIPAGADAVIMQEDTRPIPGQADKVAIICPVKPWENVRFRGEDVRQGARVFSAGRRITPSALGLGAALGITDVSAVKQPVIGLLATGNELAEPGSGSLRPGRIFESNRIALAAMFESVGARTQVFPIIPDDLTALRESLRLAVQTCDGVVTTGGVSVGEFDFVKQAFTEMGGDVSFWQVAIKPGKPFAFGRFKEKLFFGLPGNPVSALVTALVLVRPAILRWQGGAENESALLSHPGVLLEPLSNSGSRPHYMRVAVARDGTVRSAGIQASHILTSLAEANGVVEVPPETTLGAGASVVVLRWD